MPRAIRNWMPAAVALAGCLAAGGCNNGMSSPSSFLAFVPGPTPTIYAGALRDSSTGSGTATVSLSSAGGLTSGTWQMAFGGKTEPARIISGTVNGTTYTATVVQCSESGDQSCYPNCHLSFTGSISSVSLIGTYTAPSGDGCQARSGTLNAARQ